METSQDLCCDHHRYDGDYVQVGDDIPSPPPLNPSGVADIIPISTPTPQRAVNLARLDAKLNEIQGSQNQQRQAPAPSPLPTTLMEGIVKELFATGQTDYPIPLNLDSLDSSIVRTMEDMEILGNDVLDLLGADPDVVPRLPYTIIYGRLPEDENSPASNGRSPMSESWSSASSIGSLLSSSTPSQSSQSSWELSPPRLTTRPPNMNDLIEWPPLPPSPFLITLTEALALAANSPLVQPPSVWRSTIPVPVSAPIPRSRAERRRLKDRDVRFRNKDRKRKDFTEARSPNGGHNGQQGQDRLLLSKETLFIVPPKSPSPPLRPFPSPPPREPRRSPPPPPRTPPRPPRTPPGPPRRVTAALELSTLTSRAHRESTSSPSNRGAPLYGSSSSIVELSGNNLALSTNPVTSASLKSLASTPSTPTTHRSPFRNRDPDSDSEDTDSEEILSFGYKLSNNGLLNPGSEVSLVSLNTQHCNETSCQCQGDDHEWESVCRCEGSAEKEKDIGRRAGSRGGIFGGPRKAAAWGMGLGRKVKETSRERVSEEAEVPTRVRGRSWG